jgi:hypothetical protein
MARNLVDGQPGTRLRGWHALRVPGVLTLAVGVVAALSIAPAAAGESAEAAGPAPAAAALAARLPLAPGFPAGPWGPTARWRFDPLPALPANATAPPAGDPWRVQPTPNPAMPNGVLFADSCTSASACTAVGDYENTFGSEVSLAERWNGANWRVQDTPNPSGAILTELSGVSCTSADACSAVGYSVSRSGHSAALAEWWNGRRWVIRATPNLVRQRSSGLFAVSCRSARVCMAVGAVVTSTGQTVTLAERWNGQRWMVQPTVNPGSSETSQLLAVSCNATDACTAVGVSGTSAGSLITLAEGWNGASWTIQSTASPAGAVAAGLSAISCTAVNFCTAVGQYATAAFPALTLVLTETWSGTGWQIQPAPSPAPPPQETTSGSGLLAVSCASPTACTAVGYYTSATVGGSGAAPLAERWNGAQWVIQPTPNPARSLGGGLATVSCSSPTDCIAAGSYQVVIPPAAFGNLPTPAHALAESWTGKNWRILVTANPPGAVVDSVFSGASCVSSRACTAIGDYTNTTGNLVALAEAWNGTRWRIQRTPLPAHSRFPDFNAVSCTSARACTAVGSYFNSAFNGFALAERWNGADWVIQATPRTANAALYGVSCASAQACIAVGSAGKKAILVETWNGTRWRLQSAPKPVGGTGGLLAGVSCTSARTCTAVGSYTTSAGKRLTLAETWNGVRWRTRPTPNPKGAVSAELSSVSCNSARACTAVGASTITIKLGKLPVSESRPLTEIWNGTRWRIRPIQSLSGAVSTELGAVSCSSVLACTAAGNSTNSIGGLTAVVANWDGKRWTLRAAVVPADAVSGGLNGVSCAGSRDCTAVGWYAGLSGISLTLAIAS